MYEFREYQRTPSFTEDFFNELVSLYGVAATTVSRAPRLAVPPKPGLLCAAPLRDVLLGAAAALRYALRSGHVAVPYIVAEVNLHQVALHDLAAAGLLWWCGCRMRRSVGSRCGG